MAHWFLTKVPRTFNGKNVLVSTNGSRIIDICRQRMMLDSYLYTNGLERSVLTAKLSEENMQVSLHDLPLGISS